MGAPVVRPGVPTGRDLHDVTHGREVPPDRREAAWALVDAFVAATARDSLAFEADDRTIDDLDFEMAAAGLPSRYGLRQLFKGDTALPIKLLPGMADGYVRNRVAVAMASAWGEAVGQLEGEHALARSQRAALHHQLHPAFVQRLARRVAGWLGVFTNGAPDADEAGRPAPDLVVWYRS